MIANVEGLKATVGFRVPAKELNILPRGPTTLNTDASAVIDGVLMDKVSRQSRYLCTRQHMMRQGLEDGTITLKKIPGEENVANLGTKPMAGAAFIHQRALALGLDEEHEF